VRALPIDKEMRERARKENLYVVQVCFSGQYYRGKNGKGGGSAMTGTFSREKVKQLENYFWKWYKGTK